MPRFNTALAEEYGLAKDRFPTTAQEADMAEQALASEMDKLSLEEHEKILFDVHGIANAYDEDPECLTEHLEELEKELRKIPEKSAYEQAMYMNKEYVRSKKFRLMFLRGERFDSKAAAAAIVLHFYHKRDLFGAGEVLARDVRMSDLTKDDVACLKAGFLQVLPSRDGSDRAVAFLTPGHKTFTTMDSLLRAHWYFFHRMLLDGDTQKYGIVLVIYNVGKCGSNENWSFMQHFRSVEEGLPLKKVATHVCYNDESTRPYMTGVRLFMDEDYRKRCKPHFNSAEGIGFHLQTYAIPTEDFPINEDETLVLDWHLEWLEAQRVQEIASAQNRIDESIIIPRRFDVLFGRGRDTRVHTGNLRAAHLVEMYQTKYEKANKFEKTEIAERIVAIIHESYGRFLKWEKGGWVEVEYNASRAKVAHFFRHLRSKKTDTRPPSTIEANSGANSGSSMKKTRKALLNDNGEGLSNELKAQKRLAPNNPETGAEARQTTAPATRVC